MRASCDRIDIDKQKTISQTLRFPYNARVYIMRASYDSIDNKLKQKIFGKVNKDITFIQFFHSTPLHSTELFKILFSLLTLQLLFCKKLVGLEKMCGKVNKDIAGKKRHELSCQPNTSRASYLSNMANTSDVGW